MNVKIIAIILFIICLIMQIGFIVSIFTDSGEMVWNIICATLLLIAEILIIKYYPAYARRYGGPKFY